MKKEKHCTETKDKRKTVVKADYRNEENACFIFDELAEGKSLREICRENGWKKTTVYEWLHNNYSDRYARARELQAEFYVDEIREIADFEEIGMIKDEKGKLKVDYEAVARAKLRIDSRKWIASHLLPKKYGDKIDVNQHGNVGVTVMPEVRVCGVPLKLEIGDDVENEYDTRPGDITSRNS